MEDVETPPGKVVIAPEVLITIAKLSTLAVPGVASMAPIPGGIDRYVRRGYADGVRIMVKDQSIAADLYIVIQGGVNAHTVSAGVQQEVARALNEMVGMDAGQINVHVADVAFKEEEA